jgi:selenocysteine lyase/cysteine desulfurase
MENCRELFDFPEGVAYFNCASVGPLMRKARAAIDEAVVRRCRPWSISMKEWIDDFEQRRALFARLIGANPENIALVPAASYGAATAARNLRATTGSRILMPAEDFPSDVYSWRAFAESSSAEVHTVGREPEQTWTDAVLSHLDERCSVVAVPNVHWTNGGLFDLPAISQRCREVGARLVVDASQSLGVMPLDLDVVRPDFLFAVGYKWMLGPYGLGYLYVADEHLDGVPLEQNWLSREGSEDFARLVDYVERYRPGARRYDMGERSQLELTRAACITLEQLVEWGVSRMAETLGALTARIEAHARELGLHIGDRNRGPHIVGIDLPERAAGDIPRATVRDDLGAVEILQAANVFVGLRGRSLRIAPHMYTNEADMQRLFAALEKIVTREPSY